MKFKDNVRIFKIRINNSFRPMIKIKNNYNNYYIMPKEIWINNKKEIII